MCRLCENRLSAKSTLERSTKKYGNENVIKEASETEIDETRDARRLNDEQCYDDGDYNISNGWKIIMRLAIIMRR